MNLFFLIKSLQLLLFYMDDKEFLPNSDYVLLFFSFITSSKLIIFFIVTFNLFLSLTKSLLAPYTYVSIESVDCILLSLFELKAILLISSVKTLCFSLLNICCIFNIDLSFFINSFLFSLILSMPVFYSETELLLNKFYNFQI